MVFTHPLYFNAYRRSAACHRLSRSLLNLVTMAQQLRAGEGRKEAPSRWPWAALWHAYATGLEIQLYIVQLLWTLRGLPRQSTTHCATISGSSPSTSWGATSSSPLAPVPRP